MNSDKRGKNEGQRWDDDDVLLAKRENVGGCE